MKTPLFIAAAALALASAAHAQTPGAPGGPAASPSQMRPNVRQACAHEAQTLCPGMQARERSFCLLDNLEKLNPECKAALGVVPTPPSRPASQQEAPAQPPPQQPNPR